VKGSTIKIEMQLSRRKVRISALMLLAAAVLSLGQCAYVFFNQNFLKSGSAYNPVLVNDMRVMINVANDIVIPGLSILLVFSSHLIWRLSNKIEEDK
jgi:hypothetical protein